MDNRLDRAREQLEFATTTKKAADYRTVEEHQMWHLIEATLIICDWLHDQKGVTLEQHQQVSNISLSLQEQRSAMTLRGLKK